VYAPSNVVKLVKALRHGKLTDVPTGTDPVPTDQLVFYDKGVGTGNWLDRLVGGATGEGLEQNVRDGYDFLVTHYQPGDRIYLVGFSRGAYTVRRLAGFLGRFGLWERAGFPAEPTANVAPDPTQGEAIKRLYAQFLALTANSEPPTEAQPNCLAVAIEVLGVWDTVGALGLPGNPLLNMLLGWNGRRKHEFVDATLSPKVHYAYHALALDEPRAAFKPTLWDHDPVREKAGTLVQTWFAGAHSNVGGSYQECGLADITLGWMIDHLRERGLLFRENYVARTLQPDWYGEVRNPREGWGWLLYPTTYKRVPTLGTTLHESVREREVPTTFFSYRASAPPEPSGITESPGLFVNHSPTPDK
jgi:uncharacterized protein (DUF2235 family)